MTTRRVTTRRMTAAQRTKINRIKANAKTRIKAAVKAKRHYPAKTWVFDDSEQYEITQ